MCHGVLNIVIKGKQSDKDSNVQLKLNAEVATKKEDSGAPKKPCAKVISLDIFPILKLIGYIVLILAQDTCCWYACFFIVGQARWQR